MKFIDLTGQKFGRLTVIKKNGKDKNGQSLWICKCNCDNKVTVLSGNLKKKNTQSCGCLNKEMNKYKNYKHGMVYTRFYTIWRSMLERCLNKNTPYYKHYGERGITVCKRWHKFENFYEDMYPSYLEHVEEFGEKNTSIEREKNNLGYSKEKCSWKTRIEQNNNKRNNHFLTYKGRKQTVAQWARELKINPTILWHKLNKNNWSIKNICLSQSATR